MHHQSVSQTCSFEAALNTRDLFTVESYPRRDHGLTIAQRTIYSKYLLIYLAALNGWRSVREEGEFSSEDQKFASNK